MEIGARIGKFNTSIIAYCDDLLLLSLNEMHMNKLLDCCHSFVEKWKMQFNASKSISFSFPSPPILNFKLVNSFIPKSGGFIYLGFPIGNDEFIEDFITSVLKSTLEFAELPFFILISLKTNYLFNLTIFLHFSIYSFYFILIFFLFYKSPMWRSAMFK